MTHGSTQRERLKSAAGHVGWNVSSSSILHSVPPFGMSKNEQVGCKSEKPAFCALGTLCENPRCSACFPALGISESSVSKRNISKALQSLFNFSEYQDIAFPFQKSRLYIEASRFIFFTILLISFKKSTVSSLL